MYNCQNGHNWQLPVWPKSAVYTVSQGNYATVGSAHSGERWMSRPFVHSGNLNFKHTVTNDFVFHNAWKRIICHFITQRTCCWRDHSQCCLCPHYDFHLPPSTEGFLIHLSPLWQLPLWQLPLFPSVAQFPCICNHFNTEYAGTVKCHNICKRHISIGTGIKLNKPVFSTLFQWHKYCNCFRMYIWRNCAKIVSKF